MSRKNALKPYHLIIDGDMSGNLTSDETNVQYLDNVGLIIQWSGTAPVGTITVEVKIGDSAWSELEFGSTISIASDSGSHNVNINQIPHEKIRVKYNFISGVGVLNIYSTAKMV